jgi:uncharacterized protein
MQDRILTCPNENIEMQKIKTEAHYGQTVIIDQCPGCGGIWFDSFELYMPKQGQAGKIESINVGTLKSISVIENSELLCPRDHNKLIRFQDPFFPKDLILARCSTCNGFWLNRGEFLKYQHFRQTRQESSKPKEILIEDNNLDQDIRRVWEENKTKDSTELIGKMGKFLSMPVDQATWQPMEPDKLSEKERNAYNLVMTALTLILRFFIRI